MEFFKKKSKNKLRNVRTIFEMLFLAAEVAYILHLCDNQYFDIVAPESEIHTKHFFPCRIFKVTKRKK